MLFALTVLVCCLFLLIQTSCVQSLVSSVVFTLLVLSISSFLRVCSVTYMRLLLTHTHMELNPFDLCCLTALLAFLVLNVPTILPPDQFMLRGIPVLYPLWSLVLPSGPAGSLACRCD